MPGSPHAIQAGARLDRLPIGTFHRRILWLIGLGMVLDASDIYIAGGIPGVAACLSGAMLLMATTVIALGRETSNRALEDMETPLPPSIAIQARSI